MNRWLGYKSGLWNGRSLRSKILMIFLLLISIPLSLQGYITYSHFSSTLERRTADYAVQIADQINRNLDQTLAEAQRLSLVPLYDPQVLKIMGKYSDPVYFKTRPTIEEMDKMFLFLSGSAYNRPSIRGIQVFARNGVIFTNVDSNLIRFYTDVQREAWYERVRVADGAWVAIPQHRPTYYLDSKEEAYFSVARLLREPNSNRPLGTIKIDMKLDVFKEILSTVNFGDMGILRVLNGSDEVFFEQSADALEPRLREALLTTSMPNKNRVTTTELGGRKFLTIVDYSEYSNLKVVSYIPMPSLLKETYALRDFTMAIAAVCLIVAGGLALYFSYRLSVPLVRLKQKMRLVEQGNFKQQVPVETQDELGQLSNGFNRMVEEIDRLVHEVYVIGLREKEAELAALQSRINPHFMYNTLESINMMALRHSNYDVSDMVTALGRLLRYTVDKYDRLVRLKDELDSTASYIKIQQLRYDDRLRVYIDADESLYDLPVPKLILQPLVENAIYHGIGDREAGGTIWITAVRFEEQLLLTVTDDGAGISEHELEALRLSMTKVTQESGERGGLALRNIHQRLVLMYGSDYALEADGSPGEGMAFTITLPIHTERSSVNV